MVFKTTFSWSCIVNLHILHHRLHNNIITISKWNEQLMPCKAFFFVENWMRERKTRLKWQYTNKLWNMNDVWILIRMWNAYWYYWYWYWRLGWTLSTKQLASPQMPFGVRLSRNECVTKEPQRTSAGRLQNSKAWTKSISICHCHW